MRGLIASGNTPSVLLTHVTTVGPVDFSMLGWLPMMSMRSVALPLQNDTYDASERRQRSINVAASTGGVGFVDRRIHVHAAQYFSIGQNRDYAHDCVRVRSSCLPGSCFNAREKRGLALESSPRGTVFEEQAAHSLGHF